MPYVNDWEIAKGEECPVCQHWGVLFRDWKDSASGVRERTFRCQGCDHHWDGKYRA